MISLVSYKQLHSDAHAMLRQRWRHCCHFGTCLLMQCASVYNFWHERGMYSQFAGVFVLKGLATSLVATLRLVTGKLGVTLPLCCPFFDLL